MHKCIEHGGTTGNTALPELLTVPAHTEEATHNLACIVQVSQGLKQGGHPL